MPYQWASSIADRAGLSKRGSFTAARIFLENTRDLPSRRLARRPPGREPSVGSPSASAAAESPIGVSLELAPGVGRAGVVLLGLVPGFGPPGVCLPGVDALVGWLGVGRAGLGLPDFGAFLGHFGVVFLGLVPGFGPPGVCLPGVDALVGWLGVEVFVA